MVELTEYVTVTFAELFAPTVVREDAEQLVTWPLRPQDVTYVTLEALELKMVKVKCNPEDPGDTVVDVHGVTEVYDPL